jgi:hypothetical protein
VISAPEIFNQDLFFIHYRSPHAGVLSNQSRAQQALRFSSFSCCIGANLQKKSLAWLSKRRYGFCALRLSGPRLAHTRRHQQTGFW